MVENKVETKTEEKKTDEKPALSEQVGEQVLPPAQWDEVQIEAAALFVKDVFTEGILDKKEVAEGVKKRREDYAKWEEKQAKVAEERSKKTDRS